MLAAIPLGGYVKMLDEREGNVDSEELDRAFNRKSVWARIAIVLAGPLANLILAYFSTGLFSLLVLLALPRLLESLTRKVRPQKRALNRETGLSRSRIAIRQRGTLSMLRCSMRLSKIPSNCKFLSKPRTG